MEGDQTLMTRGEQRRVLDTMHHNNHTTLHMEADMIRSHMKRQHHLTDLILGTIVLSQQWAEITTVSRQFSLNYLDH